MENKLIVAVCSRPVMYDTTDYNYRNRNMKEDAWKSISEEIGVPVEACRKKWKNLRDMYLKEKKKDSDKKSGSAAFAWKKWKYSASLSFLDPFLSPRETSGNTDPGFQEQTSDCDLMPPVEEDEEEEEAAAAVAKLTEAEETSGFEDGISPSPEAKSPLALPAAAPLAPGSPSSSSASSPAPPGTSSSAAGSTKPPRRKRRQTQEDTNIDRQILQILKDGPKNISATENFFLSLIPMMEQLPPRRQEMVKMRFQSILFEELVAPCPAVGEESFQGDVEREVFFSMLDPSCCFWSSSGPGSPASDGSSLPASVPQTQCWSLLYYHHGSAGCQFSSFFTSRELGFMFPMETWLQAGDFSLFSELLPPDCGSLSSPADSSSSFVVQLVEIKRESPVLCVVIYSLPKFNKDFLQDFADLLSEIILKNDRILIGGDLNIHVCCETRLLTKDFLIRSLNLQQLARSPPHEKGHILHLVLSLGLHGDVKEILDSGFSDHLTHGPLHPLVA